MASIRPRSGTLSISTIASARPSFASTSRCTTASRLVNSVYRTRTSFQPLTSGTLYVHFENRRDHEHHESSTLSDFPRLGARGNAADSERGAGEKPRPDVVR